MNHDWFVLRVPRDALAEMQLVIKHIFQLGCRMASCRIIHQAGSRRLCEKALLRISVKENIEDAEDMISKLVF